MEQQRSGPSGPTANRPIDGEERELSLDLVHATEAAALACSAKATLTASATPRATRCARRSSGPVSPPPLS